MTPQNLIKVDIKPIFFNEKRITAVFIDLEHINKGKDRKRIRSNLEIRDILKFIFLLNDVNLESEMMRGNYLYYSCILKDEDEKKYKIVFCQDHTSNWIGIITIYRIKS